MNKPREPFQDSDPSFIRRPAVDLFQWAGRVGLSHREVIDAVADGLIRPEDKLRLRAEEIATAKKPDITLP
jgi:hypothetical protein